MKKTLFLLAAILMALSPLSATITVSSPATGNDWSIGETYVIRWLQSGVLEPNIDIRLRVAGSPDSDPPALSIVDDTGNDGAYSWLIPASVAPGSYFIRVKTDTVVGDSGNFTITAVRPGTTAITVSSPAAGDAWSIGRTYTIRWLQSGVREANVDIRLRVSDSPDSDPPALSIVDDTGNDGAYSWPIPASVAPGSYFIRVKTDTVVGDSGNFRISGRTTTPTISVTEPNASSSWRPGSRQTITWTKTGELNPMANITLRREGAPETEAAAARIADGCANNGSRIWFIPESLAEGRYFIRVKEGIAGGVKGDSAVFAINAEGRGSDLPGPDTPIRADLSMPGVGIEYYNGHVVAWVKNNGPDSVRDHNVKFRLNFPERGGGEQIITKRITVPVGAEEGVQLLAMAAGDIPDVGLRTIVSVDTALSHIQDANRLNQHRDVRLYADNRAPIDLAIALYSRDTNISYVLLDAGGPFFRRYRIRATMRLRNNSDSPAEIRRVKCNWQTQSRNTFETTWREGYPRSSGSLQLGPFRRGEETTYSFEFDFIIKDFHDVVYYRVMFELDPDHLLNDPDRGNNIAVTGQFDHD